MHAVARIAALGAKLGINSKPKEGDVKQKQGETLKTLAWGTKREHSVVT